MLHVVSPADHDEPLPESNEGFVSRPPPPAPRGHSLALSASSLTPAPDNSGLNLRLFTGFETSPPVGQITSSLTS